MAPSGAVAEACVHVLGKAGSITTLLLSYCGFVQLASSCGGLVIWCVNGTVRHFRRELPPLRYNLPPPLQHALWPGSHPHHSAGSERARPWGLPLHSMALSNPVLPSSPLALSHIPHLCLPKTPGAPGSWDPTFSLLPLTSLGCHPKAGCPHGSSRHLLVGMGRHDRIPWAGWLSPQTLLAHSPRPPKSQAKVLADSVPGEDTLTGLLTPVHPLAVFSRGLSSCEHMERELFGVSSCEDPHPQATTQGVVP